VCGRGKNLVHATELIRGKNPAKNTPNGTRSFLFREITIMLTVMAVDVLGSGNAAAEFRRHWV
jgi:hypothetical protein